MVLVANKVDLVHLRKVTADQGQEMAAKHNVSSEPGRLFAVNWFHIFEFRTRVFKCACLHYRDKGR